MATISRAALAAVARAFGQFTDIKVGFLHGHSARVAKLAATGAETLGCSHAEVSEDARRGSSRMSAGWRCPTGSGTSPAR